MRYLVAGIYVGVLMAGTALEGRAAGDPVEEGYVSLFNGKDLTGWRYYKETDLAGKTETADKRFRVADGVIVAEEGKGIKDLYTVRDFNKEFTLKLEFRAAAKADSGVYVRGPQLQVRDYHRRNEMKQLKKFKTDDWNELDITVKHGVVSTSVNGKNLTEQDSLDVTFKGGKPLAKLNGTPVEVVKIDISVGAIAKCLCNGEFVENMKVPTKSGQGIGLQAESGKFEFRRIRVKE